MASLSRPALAALVPPALLAALLPGGCSSGVGRSDRLEREFPAHAAEVLGRPASRFVETTHGFAPAESGGSIDLALPRTADASLAIRTPAGLDLEVRELGASGPGTLAEHAVVYARSGITSYWTSDRGGVEEWILVDAGVARRGAPLLAWEIAGASLVQKGEAVEVVGATPLAKLRVTAPAAYAASGRPVHASLHVEGRTIQLFVDAEGEALLVDPQWLPAASMAQARYYHAAARLQNGQVLVCGGTTGVVGIELDSAEVYDPVADQWSPAGTMATARANLTATTLTDGTVLVVGGTISQGNAVVGTTEVFDPAGGGSWTPKNSVPNARGNHTATRLASGKVLVAGGYGGSGFPTSMSDVEIYDPNLAGGDWTFTDALFDSRARHTATLLADNRVLVAGGDGFGAPDANAEIYDETTGTWTQTAVSMNDARENHGAALLADGTVLVVGGDDATVPTPTPLASAEIYDPVADTWTLTAPLLAARTGATTTLLSNGMVLVAGGEDQVSSLATAEIYDPVAQTWSAAPSLAQARADHTATRIGGGKVLVAGGDAASVEIASAEIYDPGLPNGATCSQPTDCASGFCVGSLCCDAACDTTCSACDMTETGVADGTCGPSLATVVCEVAYCDSKSNAAHPRSFCDGAGTCNYTSGIDCSPGTCQNGKCIIQCTADPDCPTDQYCKVDHCANKKAIGAPAMGGNECTSSFAHDGFCCDAACDGGICEACAKSAGATADGHCTELPAKCDDGNSCTADACTAGACSSLSLLDGTPCEGGVCIAGVCLLDAAAGSSSANGSASNGSGGGASSAAAGSGGAGGSAGGGTGKAAGELVGGGCSASPAEPVRSGGLVSGLLGLLFAWRRRRAATSARR